MKHFNEFINESLDNTIFEGFLDKLKNAIEKVVDDPQKYFDIAKKQIEDLKDKGFKWNYDLKTPYYKFVRILSDEKQEAKNAAKEMEELNNDETLKSIYQYVKTALKDKNHVSHEGLTRDDYSGKDELLKDIQKEFKCEEIKAFCIMQIAMAISLAYQEQHQQKSKSSNSYSSHSSSSSRSKRVGVIAGCVAASMRMRH